MQDPARVWCRYRTRAAAGGPTGGSLLLFKLPIPAIENRPMDLEIAPPLKGIAPKDQRIELDI